MHVQVTDGFAASKAIRRAEVLTVRHAPIVAMTANALEGDRDAHVVAGTDDYVALRRAIARRLPASALPVAV